ncbi:MAG: ATP-binding protein [Gemmobacter sp.]|jgi:serine/threonine-protein kinase RsbW|nr:ATP-binding protein [Gemmobacter sp.]
MQAEVACCPETGDAAWTIRLALQGDALAVRRGLGLLFTDPRLAALSPDSRGTAEIVLAEVLNNIVEHAYALVPGGVEVTIRLLERGLCCCIRDHGAPMPGLELPPGQPVDCSDELPEGGFGWFMIRSLARNLRYCRGGRWNELCFLLPVNE